MKLRLLSFLLVISLLASCTSIYSTVENVNNKKTYDSKEQYIETVNKKNHIAKDKIIILNDDELTNFIYEIASKRLSTYYGIANKSYFVSAEQLSIKSCSGQMTSLYKLFIDDDKSITKSDASEIPFLTNLQLDKSKNTVIFIYSHKLGGMIKSKINAVINELEKENTFDYRVISIDNPDIIHKTQ